MGEDGRAPAPAGAATDAAARRQAALVEHASDVVVVLDAGGVVRYANPAAERVLGYHWRPGDAVDVLSLVHADDRTRCSAAIASVLERPGAGAPGSYRLAHADGTWRHVEAIANNLTDDPAVGGFVITLRDLTDQRDAEARLRTNAGRHEALAELGRWALAGLEYSSLIEDAVGVLARQLDAELVHVFQSYADASLLTLVASRGPVPAGGELVSNDPTSSPASFALVTQQTVVSADLANEERFDVPSLWSQAGAVSVIEAPIRGDDMPIGVVGVGSREPRRFEPEEVSFVAAVANVLAAAAARTAAERTVREQVLEDPLTGLSNRLLLSEHTPTALARSPRPRHAPAPDRTVFVADVDRFKEINNTLGHATGDLVLIELANRLRRLGEPLELVARLGGDEFAVVTRGLSSPEGEERFAAHLVAAIGAPLDVGGVNLRLRASVGFASAADAGLDSADVPQLVRRAEMAMYRAKAGHGGVRRFVEDLERSGLSRLALASELAEAIEHGQLRLDYQPKVVAGTGVLAGVEALVRWQHPTRGLLPPDVFVPLAEQTGVIRELTSWVLGRALAECASWHRAGWIVPVAVNLSAGTIHDPSMLEPVRSSIARAGLPAGSVDLEITESAVMLDPEGALESLEELVGHGVQLSLDDFGTGYSSLAYLQRLPVTSVKIDKSFVTPLTRDETARAIVRTVVELGHSLELSVVAEGVDSAEVLAVASELGCDALQGYHVAIPMEPGMLRRWIAEHSRSPAAGPRAGEPGAGRD